LASQVVIVTVELRNLPALDLLNKRFTAFVVDFVILQLKLLQSVALLHKLCDHLSAHRRDFVVSKNQGLQLLFLFVCQCCNNNFDSFVSDVVASDIEDPHGLGVGQRSLQLLHSRETDVVPLQTEHLEVLFVLKSLAKRSSTVGEDAVV